MLLFGDSKTAAAGLKHRAQTLAMKAAQRAGPKGISTESPGNFLLCVQRVFWAVVGRLPPAQHHQVLGLRNEPITCV